MGFRLKKKLNVNCYEAIKRLFDIIFAILLILLTSPMLLIIAILIKKEDGGPIIFTQIRVGKKGKLFKLFKLRSMKYSQKEISSEGNILPKETLKEARLRYQTTRKDDKRITKLGRFIRKYHLDEFPQLINVIKGEMSFVGIRPVVPSEQADYSSEFWAKRISIKPGLTSLGIVSKASTIEEIVKFDLKYLKQRNIISDLEIIIKTIFKPFYKRSF